MPCGLKRLEVFKCALWCGKHGINMFWISCCAHTRIPVFPCCPGAPTSPVEPCFKQDIMSWEVSTAMDYSPSLSEHSPCSPLNLEPHQFLERPGRKDSGWLHQREGWDFPECTSLVSHMCLCTNHLAAYLYVDHLSSKIVLWKSLCYWYTSIPSVHQ